MMILGSSGSGKTYLLLNKILPAIKDIYDIFVIFTREFNVVQYRQSFNKMFKKSKKDPLSRYFVEEEFEPLFITETDNIMPMIERIKELQGENMSHYDKDGVPVYNDNILFIFDDILRESMFKDDRFLEVFVNLRHLQISTILLAQITNKAISTQMKANTNFFVVLSLNGYHQRRFPISLIAECVEKDNPDIGPKKSIQEARKIYRDSCTNKQYGYLVIDEFSNYQ